MSKVTKWKLEKAKVKVVFRLQFHATHIPQKGWEKLFISFIPTDTGKATAKTSKANVRNGTCKWADPIYETTRLLLDSTTKQYDDKLYKLVVGMGTSRSSILGEAIINLADYADATQPSAIALPLNGTDHGTVLHVSVQLLTAKTGFREFEQQRDKGLQSGNNVNKETEPSTAKSSSSELEIPDDQVNKAKTQIRLRVETNIHEEYPDSHVTFDGSSNASENYNIHEVDSVKSRLSGSQSSPTEKTDGSDHRKLAQRSGSNYSMDNDVAIVYEENYRLKDSLELAESSISELKRELTVLQSHANEIGTETQKFSQELANEIASSQELSQEVNFLKSECSKFKNDLQKLTDLKPSTKTMERKLEKTDHDKQVNGVLLLEGQIQELQEKIYVRFPESDLSFLQSDFEVLFSTVQDLQKETLKPESMLHTREIPSLPLEELLGELDVAKAENENLVKKMNQMESYYEALVQELEENQKRILGEFQTLKTETESLSLIKTELQKRATTSESALKRARLNYSIAVSQLQKDLDMLSFQVLSMFETNQTVIKEAFIYTSPPSSKHLVSDDLKKSLSLQENIYKKVEEELGEMCCANLHLNMYSGTLKETLFEASEHIRKMNEKLQELAHQLQLSNESRDALFVRLQTAAEDINTLSGQNTYHLAKCNDLQTQNQMLDADLGNLSNENFLLMEKISECEALLADYQVYKSKHDIVSAEKRELENLLQVQEFDNQKNTVLMKEEVEVLRSEIRELTRSKETVQKENDEMRFKFENGVRDTVMKMETLNASLDKLQSKVDSVANKLKASLESGEQHLQNSEEILSYFSSLQLELEKMLSEDKSFAEQITGLEMMVQDFEKSYLTISELKQENQDLMIYVENKREELSKLVLELHRLKECLDVERRMKNQLEGTVAHLTSELESHRSELGHRESENSRALQLVAQHEESLETLHKERAGEDLKLIFVKTQYEGKIDELVKQLRELENNHIDDKARYIQENESMVTTFESLQMKVRDTEVRLNELLESEARYMDENKTLSATGAYVRLELEASLKSNGELALEVGQLKDTLAKSEAEIGKYIELQMKLQDTELRLNQCLTNEARYIEENGKLAAELESLKLELEASVAHNAEIVKAKNKLALEVGQLKDMLIKSESEIGKYNELQTKLLDTESKLNRCLENEARYIEENGKLASELESLRLEFEASVAHNAEILESKKERALEVSKLKDMLTKSESEVGKNIELQTKLHDCLEENEKLSLKLESVRLELDASIAQLSESKNELAIEVGQLKAEVGKYIDLQTKLQDTESRLNQCLENEAQYMEENQKLATEIKSVRLELEEVSVAHNAKVLESSNALEEWKSKAGMFEYNLLEVKDQHVVELGQLKDMLAKSESEVEQYQELETKLHETEAKLNNCTVSETCYIEENKKLSTTLEHVRLELEASLKSNSKHALQVSQLKSEVAKYRELEKKLQDTESRLNHCLENEARYMEENEKLSTTLESVRSELEASIASKNEHALEVGQLKEEVRRYMELQTKLQVTESRLKDCLENETRYIEENGKLASEIKSLKSELEASVPRNNEVSSELKGLESKLLDTHESVADVDDTLASCEESEIVSVVLKGKLDEQNDELMAWQNKCSELKDKLAEQILKTEKYKNLSVYLKELKENGDVAREKKDDPEGPSESLRLAFIKEQYQTNIQELKQQLSVTKKHNEEMLFKLQDTLDEIESMKKSDTKPDYDRIQAELECAVLSLECCKEEKEKLVGLLQECEDEKMKVTEELSLIRGQIGQKEENGYTGVNGSTHTGEEKHAVTPTTVLAIQRAYEDGEDALVNDDSSKQLTVVNDQFRAQHLRSCMEQLDEELERMKNDNSLFPLANYDPSVQDLQRELAQLHQANEELVSIYPNFVDLRGNGNALERVLALEIELAEALRAKQKPSIQFQSSFLKQHSDDEAVFKSFRDINELINDMLEIKGKYVNVESELKEMHDRYSQLSLQFAEVEGERQKLMMTLKNVRSSRKLLRRASIGALEDHPL